MSRRKDPTPPELLTSPELAHSVLAAWLLGCPARDVPFLRAEHFSDERDRTMWDAILELEAEGIVGDYAALIERVKRIPSLEQTDWPVYGKSILDSAEFASSLSFQTNARTLYDNWRRLQAYQLHTREAKRALDLSAPPPPAPEAELAPEERKRWSVASLLQAEFDEPRGPWPGIIPVGLTVIGARPKYGKSLLMLQVSAAVGSGGTLFGHAVKQVPVLYYALEDSPKRLKERITRLDVPASAKIDFAREIRPLHTGGLADVEAAARDYGLIVLDTISRAVPGQDLNREAALYGDLLGRLQTVALDRKISIVTVVHTRKPNGMEHDPIDDVLGSTQMTAAADCVLAIYRQQGHSLLKGRARDMEDIDLTIEFDPATVSWQLVGQTEEVRQTENESAILDALRQLGGAKVSAIAQAVGKDRANTSRRLVSLWTRGLCKREVRGNEAYFFIEDTLQNPTTHPTQGTLAM